MNANDWIWTSHAIKDSPSRGQGITSDVEGKLRREGIKIIMEVGSALGLKANPTLATAGVFFHRFYMFHPFNEFPRELTALGCIFLSGKLEETPKKCKDIATAALNLPQFAALFRSRHMTIIDDIMWSERALLKTLKFDFQVEHPYSFLYPYACKLNLDQEETKKLVQTAWTFVNDSISTTLCLQYEPQVLAISMLHLACKLKSSPKSSEDIWWDDVIGNLTFELIDIICHKLLDFYSQSKEETLDFLPFPPPSAYNISSTYMMTADIRLPPPNMRR